MSKKILLLLLGIFFISSVYALGCCFDQNMGTCSPNSESSSCSGGQFYSDASCASVGECDYGCCQIGTQVLYTRQVSCYQRAQTGGSEYQWSAGTEAQCTALQSSSSNTYGACVRATRYDKLCTYTTQSQCANGNFSAGMYCSNPLLNMNCSRTTNTTCFNEDVHYVDSCGNIDEVKSDCNYASGNICRQETSSNAICKDLNCADGHKNGDRWCVPPTGIEPGLANWQIIDGGFITVGSRYFSKYCLNGEVFTEPCADYREETCSVDDNSGKCKKNNYEDCYAANGEEDPETGYRYNSDECNEDSCIVISANDAAPCAFLSVPQEWGLVGGCKNDPDVKERMDTLKANGITVDEKENPFLVDLGIGVCAPVVVPGSDLSSSSSSTDSTCSYGDYTAQVVLKADRGKSHFGSTPDPVTWYVSVEDDAVHKKGYAGLITLDPSLWMLDTSSVVPYPADDRSGKNPLNKFIGHNTISTIPVDESVMMTLNNLCQNMGDCVGKVNYLGSGGSGSSDEPVLTCRGDMSKRTCTLDFKCMPWKAPYDGDCQQCGSDGLPCSDYRCASIGKNCEYFEPQGADRGYCVSSSDNSAPTMSYSLSPASPIPPYSSVEITVNTNEDSICAFNLGSAGSNYESMENELGNGSYSKQHKMILNVPGRLPPTNNETSYSLITHDGNYSMYVRCQDPAGNWNLNAYLISFNVMQTPDTIPPVVQTITPSSGSYLPFNTTQKEISIKLNEPSECKWSTADKNFSDMENDFTCDSEATDYGLLNGYFCTGTITNVTLNLAQQSKYYIKCKDQPWLEGNESDLYHRNVNPTSREYVLKPSTYLTVSEVSPSGDFIVGPGVSNFTLSAKTVGGPESGKASCSWKYVYQNRTTAFYPFANTNSSMHSIVITNVSEGNFNFQVRCTDIAGNFAYKNTTVQVRVDRTAPLISRVYNDKGNLKLYTDEASYCKYMFAGGSPSCIFSLASGNLTSMYGTSAFEHTTPWRKGFTYLVKCADFYGNENSDCGMIVKTY
ncbi:Y_Y_Y domain protein [uncultured archaeon]|nr:Y_Y_Y domain protein [uncultured archaeon]